MAKILGQLFSWLVTDVIVKTLANNKLFQRTVLKVDKFHTQVERMAEEKSEEVLKAAMKTKEAATKAAKDKVETLTQQAKQNVQAQSESAASAAAANRSSPDRAGGGIVIGGFNVSTFFRHLKQEVAQDLKKK